jgi:hypothetical protein
MLFAVRLRVCPSKVYWSGLPGTSLSWKNVKWLALSVAKLTPVE